MRGRPIIHSDEELILKAQKVFWKKGYTATSLNDLLKATGTGSGSFYNTFKGGKREIFSKALEQRRNEFSNFQKKLNESENPVLLIKNFFKSIADDSNESHMKGCIIANSVLELSFVDESLENQAKQILIEVEQMYIKSIKISQERGFIKTNESPEVLGRYLITFWMGLNGLRKMYPQKESLLKQIDFHLNILN